MKVKEIEKIVNTAEKISKENYKFKNLIMKSIEHIKLESNRNNIKFAIRITVLFSLLCIYIGYSEDTIDKLNIFMEISNSIVLVLFSVSFTGYAIFQALSGGSAIKALLIASSEDKSSFEAFNISFFTVTMIYLLIIFINFIGLIIFSIIPNDWSLPILSVNVNNIIATLGIVIYSFINIYSFVEMKSFIVNLYQCFAINVVANAVEILENEKN